MVSNNESIENRLTSADEYEKKMTKFHNELMQLKFKFLNEDSMDEQVL